MPGFWKVFCRGMSSDGRRNNQRTGSRNNNSNINEPPALSNTDRGLQRIFRRPKHENSFRKRKGLKQQHQKRIDEATTASSRAFTDHTHSTLSMSLTSARGCGTMGDQELSQRFSVVRGSTAARNKSEILREEFFVEEESSDHLSDSGCKAWSTNSDATKPLVEQEAVLRPPVMKTIVTSQMTIDDSTIDCCALPVPEEKDTPRVPAYFLRKNQDYPELGFMQFAYNDIAEAGDYAARVDKPILALLTEIPSDEDFCEEVLAHPLLVEAMTTLFVPVLIVQEVTPDTPVQRTTAGRRCRARISLYAPTTLESLLDDDAENSMSSSLYGDDLTCIGLIRAMIQALVKLEKPIPKYLETLRQEQVADTAVKILVLGARESGRAEVEYAGIPGVVAAKGSFLNGQRVCVITYDHQRVSYSVLLRHALQHSLCDSVYHKGNEERVAAQVEFSRFCATPSSTSLPVMLALSEDSLDVELKDDVNSKENLRQTALRMVPLTGMQAMLANRLIHQGRFNEAMHILSPYQGQILMRVMQGASGSPKQTFYDLVDVPLLVAWRSVCEQKHPSTLLAETAPKPELVDVAERENEYDEDEGFDL